MAATAVLPFLSVEQYLSSSYEPDAEYVDGQLEERNLGEFDHADLQTELAALLRAQSVAWGIRAVVEARVQVAPGRFRVPDVCVMPLSWERTRIITEAPMLFLEVLSPEDRMARVLARCREFLAMGIPQIWLFDPCDPKDRRAYRLFSDGSLHEATGSLRLPGTPITLDLPSLFAVLDR